MSANTGNWSRNDVKRVRFDSLDISNQQNDGRKGLLERLNSADQDKTAAPAPPGPGKPRYVDMTAAFFGKQRRPLQEIKSQVLPPQPLPPLPVQQQEQSQFKRHQEVGGDDDKNRRSIPNKSPVAKELRDELAGVLLPFSSSMRIVNRTSLAKFLFCRQCLG